MRPVGGYPDIYVLGKALGGGILPISAVIANENVLGVLRPGDHGSTFGGNPLACAVAREVISQLAAGEFQERARVVGAYMHAGLQTLIGHGVTAVRGVGLWAGIDVDPELGSGRAVCEALAERGVLAKDTHGSTIRLAPPLVITEAEVDMAITQLTGAFLDLSAASALLTTEVHTTQEVLA